MAQILTAVFLRRLETNLDGTVEAIDRCDRALNDAASSYLLPDHSQILTNPENALIETMIGNNLAYTMEYNKATRELAQTIKTGWLTLDEIARLYQQNTCGVTVDNPLLDGAEIGLSWMDLTPDIKALCGSGASTAALETVRLLSLFKAEAVRLRQMMLDNIANTATMCSM